MWIVCITSVRHVLTVNGYGGRQTKENEKSWCFKGWETLVIHIFILFSERTPPQKKQKYRLLILIIYTTFTSDLTSFSFRREPQGGKNRLSAKKMNFFPSAFYSH